MGRKGGSGLLALGIVFHFYFSRENSNKIQIAVFKFNFGQANDLF
jgi:hypothetical protein